MLLNKKSLIIVLVVLFVLSLGAVEQERKLSGETVDEIYEEIRHSSPMYETQAQDLSFMYEGMKIMATLVRPKSNKRFPVVLILNGYAGDRKELFIPGTQEYLWERLSRILAEQGVASLRIDFRGSGDSDGDFTMTTFSTQISDAMAAVDYISKFLRDMVDWKNIGVLGFSQGGLVGSCTAARDERVDSLLLWSPVSHAPIVYEGLFTQEGMKQGLSLPEGGTITLGIYVNGEYVNWDVPMGKAFFVDIFRIDPVAEVTLNYEGPLMALCGQQDPIIWPQPFMSSLYLKYHEGFEKLVMLQADHAFNYWDGPEPERFHDACYWSAAWFLYTLD